MTYKDKDFKGISKNNTAENSTVAILTLNLKLQRFLALESLKIAFLHQIIRISFI